jgi:hypothetical protein
VLAKMGCQLAETTSSNRCNTWGKIILRFFLSNKPKLSFYMKSKLWFSGRKNNALQNCTQAQVQE